MQKDQKSKKAIVMTNEMSEEEADNLWRLYNVAAKQLGYSSIDWMRDQAKNLRRLSALSDDKIDYEYLLRDIKKIIRMTDDPKWIAKYGGGQMEEHMLGGVSNGSPDPGHRAKMNEGSSMEYLSKGKAHRVNLNDAKEELAELAREVVNNLDRMHLDGRDRKTERMNQNKLENIFRYLTKLKNLTN